MCYLHALSYFESKGLLRAAAQNLALELSCEWRKKSLGLRGFVSEQNIANSKINETHL